MSCDIPSIALFLSSMASIQYRQYRGDADLPHIMALVQSELSEPYVIYTFRYFLHQWYVPPNCGPRIPLTCAQATPSFLGALLCRNAFNDSNSTYQAFPADADAHAPPVGVIVCKQSVHRDLANRGYIAMLSVDRQWRKRGIGEH